jgi:hypothetical protein
MLLPSFDFLFARAGADERIQLRRELYLSHAAAAAALASACRNLGIEFGQDVIRCAELARQGAVSPSPEDLASWNWPKHLQGPRFAHGDEQVADRARSAVFHLMSRIPDCRSCLELFFPLGESVASLQSAAGGPAQMLAGLAATDTNHSVPNGAIKKKRLKALELIAMVGELKKLHPEWNRERIAQEIGINPSALSRKKVRGAVAVIFGEVPERRLPPRGRKDVGKFGDSKVDAGDHRSAEDAQ